MAIAARISAKCKLLLDESADFPQQGAVCPQAPVESDRSPAENFSSAWSLRTDRNDKPQTDLASSQRFLARATSRAEARHVGRCLRAHVHNRRHASITGKRRFPATSDNKGPRINNEATAMVQKYGSGAPLMSAELAILMAAEQTDFALLWRKNSR